ncbi:MAG TPA: type II toxin-antitoxin system VapC family toxin [Candidatus Anammoximicrobium sp.]|nr:type II toxin-antitoxin system VapC family toxin [Candidatus Anammoximicrobium sp.]
MANAIYWDTSALLKLYAPEPDSSDYLRLLIQQPEDVAISFLHRVELYFALSGKESRGEIASGSAQRLFRLFEQHVNSRRYFVIPWGDDVASEAQRLLDTSLSATPPVMLRSLDGLHLGALRAARIQSVVTADVRMRDAARIAGIGVIEP